MLKRGPLAAAARAQAVRGVRAPDVGEAAGGDLAEGNHSGATQETESYSYETSSYLDLGVV